MTDQQTASEHSFSFGDEVVHAKKPEWGTGVVSKAQNVIKDGKPAQSLTIRFKRGGLKTINTAFADIRPAEDAAPVAADAAQEPPAGPADNTSTRPTAGARNARTPPPAEAKPRPTAHSTAEPTADRPAGWLDEIASVSPDKAMARLPEACHDPFTNTEARLRATAEQFRFQPTGASILDWAAAQTGLNDPLSRFSRHELEQFFRRYADNRAEHLRALADELRKQDPAAIDRALAGAPPAARDALKRQNARR